ncbi:hypothetical protein DPEC_G00214890 [Dallia pectoralis]|uniref:Uncharacterized protein n=1 Tax=Dallia pectoralis TaxID=75939 RepID=A0ACC2G1U1_DALPE|nr:hypothetical protein DPEC_G00214890 [Dallia pectoralis]
MQRCISVSCRSPSRCVSPHLSKAGPGQHCPVSWWWCNSPWAGWTDRRKEGQKRLIGGSSSGKGRLLRGWLQASVQELMSSDTTSLISILTQHTQYISQAPDAGWGLVRGQL